MAHEILKPKSVHPAEGYSHAAKAGKTLYIAGQVAKDRDGKLVGQGDFGAQARQVFTNLKNILRVENCPISPSFSPVFLCVFPSRIWPVSF